MEISSIHNAQITPPNSCTISCTKKLLRSTPPIEELLKNSEPYAIVTIVRENWAAMAKLKLNEPGENEKFLSYARANIGLLEHGHKLSNRLIRNANLYIGKLKNPHKSIELNRSAIQFNKLMIEAIPLFTQDKLDEINSYIRTRPSIMAKQLEERKGHLTEHAAFFTNLVTDIKTLKSYYRDTLNQERQRMHTVKDMG